VSLTYHGITQCYLPLDTSEHTLPNQWRIQDLTVCHSFFTGNPGMPAKKLRQTVRFCGSANPLQ